MSDTADRDDQGRFTPGNQGGASKLDPERHQRIVELARAGNFMSVCAKGSGVSPGILRRWLRRGQADHRAGRDTPHATLFRDVRRATADAEAEIVNKLREGCLGSKSEVVTKTIRPLLGPDGLPRFAKDGSPLQVVEQRIEVARTFDWRAGQAWLQARHRSRYGAAARVDVRGKVDHVVKLSANDQRIAESIANRRLRYGDAAVVDAGGPERSLPPPEDGAGADAAQVNVQPSEWPWPD